MAVTLTQQPFDYMPVYNPQYFSATSTQTGQPNFKYSVIVTDIITGLNETYLIPAQPGGECVFDASVFTESFMTNNFNYLNGGSGAWVKYDNVRKVRVNVGEYYGTTPTRHAGSNVDFYVWNASLEFYKNYFYAPSNYIYDSSNNLFNYFRGVINDITFPDRSSYLFVLSDINGTAISQIIVKTYDINGVQIGTSAIANQLNPPTDYTDNYVFIDVGLKGMTNISSLLVTGTYPIITPSVASYKLFDGIAFQGETCNITGSPPTGKIDLFFAVDPGLIAGDTFSYTFNNPSITGAPATGNAMVISNNGGGNYTTNIPCTVSTGSIGGGTISLNNSEDGLIKQFEILCEPEYEVFTIHYLANDGSFGTVNFNKISNKNITKNTTTYNVNPNVLKNGAYGYAYESAVEKDLEITTETVITLRTDWLTDEMISIFEQCFDSPICYVDDGSNRYERVRPINTTYQQLPHYDRKLVQLQMDFKYTHQNFRQRI